VKTVLISGAGVAGLSLAYWLRHHGHAPTVVENAPAPRPGGQAVDIRGVALRVVERMGLTGEIDEVRTRMRGMSMLDAEGNEVGRSTERTHSSGRLDGEDVELLREDLNALLYRRTAAEYLFGDSVTALDQNGDGVLAHFERGSARRFDLVVGADGLHSNVRGLAFGPEEHHLRRLGTTLAVFSAPNFPGLVDWQIWLRGGTAGYGVYPVRGNTEIRVTAGFESGQDRPDRRDVEGQRRLTAERLSGLGWQTPKLVEAMWQAPDFYFDEVAQVHLDRWSEGRVTLVGDAACCPSPMSGQGTSLALVGSYVLAAELAGNAAHAAAFARYETRMRPFAALNQALATENPGGPASEESLELAKNAIVLDA
jgi:2-polyprenyl-6-methoxyphenol hydroxylase-like FAD-dependent oxidoreductase